MAKKSLLSNEEELERDNKFVFFFTDKHFSYNVVNYRH